MNRAVVKFAPAAAACLLCATAHAQLINVDAVTDTEQNPVTVMLAAGLWQVTPVGMAEGGLYDAWAFRAGVPCTWINTYLLDSPQTGRLRGSDDVAYCSAGEALANAVSLSFSLAQPAEVSFFFADSFAPDNEGGMSLWLSEMGADGDGDGVADAQDNCSAVNNPLQGDADLDGFGNACDTDLDNNCQVDFLDLGLLKAAFFSADPVADFNQDGTVDFLDLGLQKASFFQPPGPSGLTTACDQ